MTNETTIITRKRKRESDDKTITPSVDYLTKIKDFCKCPVCYEYLDEAPKMCQNGHVVCSSCHLLDTSTYCPQCRGLYVNSSPMIYRQIYNEFNFEMKCQNEFCGEVMTSSEYMTHKSNCKYRPVKCLYCTTNHSLDIMDTVLHYVTHGFSLLTLNDDGYIELPIVYDRNIYGMFRASKVIIPIPDYNILIRLDLNYNSYYSDYYTYLIKYEIIKHDNQTEDKEYNIKLFDYYYDIITSHKKYKKGNIILSSSQLTSRFLPGRSDEKTVNLLMKIEENQKNDNKNNKNDDKSDEKSD